MNVKYNIISIHNLQIKNNKLFKNSKFNKVISSIFIIVIIIIYIILYLLNCFIFHIRTLKSGS